MKRCEYDETSPVVCRGEGRGVCFFLLADRHDVIVKAQTSADRAFDLLVEVLRDGKSTLRFFGVQLVADLDLPELQHANEVILSQWPGGVSEAAFPLCVFAIGVRQPEGLYRWTVEPVVEDGRARLQRDGEAHWQTLDEAGTARLIDQVNVWYDAVNGDSTPKTNGRRSKTKS